MCQQSQSAPSVAERHAVDLLSGAWGGHSQIISPLEHTLYVSSSCFQVFCYVSQSSPFCSPFQLLNQFGSFFRFCPLHYPFTNLFLLCCLFLSPHVFIFLLSFPSPFFPFLSQSCPNPPFLSVFFSFSLLPRLSSAWTVLSATVTPLVTVCNKPLFSLLSYTFLSYPISCPAKELI